MWNLLWLLPAALLVWAIVLVVKKVKRETAEEEDDTPKTLDQRLAALDEETGEKD